MNFRLICAVAVATIGLTVSSASALEVGLGVKGGLNLARPWGNDEKDAYDDVVMRPGLLIGAALELKLSNIFAIQPEVLFSSKGKKEELEGSDFISNLSIKYLEIPLLFELLIPAGEVVTPMIYAGPALSFRTGVSGKYEVEGEKEDMSNEQIDEVKEHMKSVDFGIAMGLGLGIKAGPGKFVLDYRFTLGLMNQAKISAEDEVYYDLLNMDEPTERNMAMTFSLGYMFQF